MNEIDEPTCGMQCCVYDARAVHAVLLAHGARSMAHIVVQLPFSPAHQNSLDIQFFRF